MRTTHARNSHLKDWPSRPWRVKQKPLGYTRGSATLRCYRGATVRKRFYHAASYYFFLGGTIASFTDLATRNFTTFFAGMVIFSPVAGLRPMRLARSCRTR